MEFPRFNAGGKDFSTASYTMKYVLFCVQWDFPPSVLSATCKRERKDAAGEPAEADERFLWMWTQPEYQGTMLDLRASLDLQP